MRLDPLSLRLFTFVVEEGKIATAVEKEHLATTTRSKRLSELEYQLETQLSIRSSKSSMRSRLSRPTLPNGRPAD